MKAFPPASSFLWPQTRWPTHTSPERDLYYNVIGCARQEQRSRGRAHTHHRAESCPNSEAPSSFATAGSRRVMTEQGSRMRENNPVKPKLRWLPQPHPPKAPMMAYLLRTSAARQRHHRCLSRSPLENPRTTIYQLWANASTSPAPMAYPTSVANPRLHVFAFPHTPQERNPWPSGGPIALTQRLQQQDSNYSISAKVNSWLA